ncbi:putative acid phosphatase 5-like [Tropilaelaps mercedesae]|uniref:2-phosphoxylose phosphatase 1 n=1 Tax=Tropilaelaps mercedesae TaxID=418985 RepID=A0A1V9XGL4_9ACAR|nr:putative acid phosphatase 5-like [Tropilaelaps mercedesae]
MSKKSYALTFLLFVVSFAVITVLIIVAYHANGDPLTFQVNSDPEGFTLQHVHLLTRHSIRAPTNISSKWSNPTDYPMGIGYLTKLGKQRAVRVGTILRHFYSSFLDENPHKIWARSSTVPRCYETLSLVLSAMYPPKEKWEFDYPIQPIPIVMMPNGNDVVVQNCLGSTPFPAPSNFRYLYNLSDPALEHDNFANFGEFMEWLAPISGYRSNESDFYEPVIDALIAQRYNQLPIPGWANEKWSSINFALRKLSFDYYAYDMPYYGDYAGKFIAERIQAAANALGSDRPKLSIMTYHDSNIQAILSALQLDVTSLYPSFLAAMHFQLYKNESDGG